MQEQQRTNSRDTPGHTDSEFLILQVKVPNRDSDVTAFDSSYLTCDCRLLDQGADGGDLQRVDISRTLKVE